MKKLLYIVTGASLASVIGLANIALADEKDEPKNDEEQGITIEVPFKDAEDAYNKKGISTGGDEDEGDDVQGSGDPLKGLNVARAKKKGISTGGDEGEGDDFVKGSGDPLKGLNVTRPCNPMPCKGISTDDGDEDDSREEKEDNDG